jgi:hypothetical protein
VNVIGWPLGLVIHLLWRARAADPSPDIVVQGKVIRRTNATMSQGQGGKVYIAIDDGRQVIYAYRTTIGQARSLAEGDEVRAWVSNQGFLAGFEVLSRRSG